jgi:hypothetical protein
LRAAFHDAIRTSGLADVPIAASVGTNGNRRGHYYKEIKLKLKVRTSFDQECGPKAALAFCMSQKNHNASQMELSHIKFLFSSPLALTPERYSYVGSLDFAIQASQHYQPGEAQWLTTNTKKQPSITRTQRSPITPRLNSTAKAITRRAKNIQPKPNNIRKVRANTANKLTPKVSNRSKTSTTEQHL